VQPFVKSNLFVASKYNLTKTKFPIYRFIFSKSNRKVIQNIENPCQLSLDEMIKEVFVPLKAFDLMGNEIELDTTNKVKLLVDKNGNTKIVWNHE